MSKYRTKHAGDEPPLTLSERARLRELQRQVREFADEAEFLGKAAAFASMPDMTLPGPCQGDLAFAVLVVDGQTSGVLANPVARAFLTALAG